MEGMVGNGWGRAHDVAVAEVDSQGNIVHWEEFPVHWDVSHDQAGEGQHHARIARFLMDHQVKQVISGHMGPGMQRMLHKMEIDMVLDVTGVAREAASRYGR